MLFLEHSGDLNTELVIQMVKRRLDAKWSGIKIPTVPRRLLMRMLHYISIVSDICDKTSSFMAALSVKGISPKLRKIYNFSTDAGTFFLLKGHGQLNNIFLHCFRHDNTEYWTHISTLFASINAT